MLNMKIRYTYIYIFKGEEDKVLWNYVVIVVSNKNCGVAVVLKKIQNITRNTTNTFLFIIYHLPRKKNYYFL